ncbi:hypothetical protein TW95_gp1367 [Pandoravirus inopinatum]|uniref:Uncharacterized protein n=1 Tax=Pandoravirus inopinatum TaxID=1605721 RepID=A0A0B5JAT4_9VIRU|nr:hypothetical protein TW95_gp1367 [Pandoravirus inopinatum]AJF98101.1 hypothetical protein [Pandoravirus inopinatum]
MDAGGGTQRLLHFVRVSADEAQFSDRPPDTTHTCLGEVSVGGRASVAPAPAVGRVVLWSLPGHPTGSHDKSYGAAGIVPSNGRATSGATHVNAHHRPLFKSAIQKCTRRQMPDAAARFARALADAGGVNDLLRRAVVILIEDAIVSPRLPLLVWFMAAAAKGFTLDDADLDLVANCMGQAAALTVRDCVPPVESDPRHCARLGAPGNHPIVDALLLRVCYGGTPGDMRMLARAASMWQARLTGPTSTLWTESLVQLLSTDMTKDTNNGPCSDGDDGAVFATARVDGKKAEIKGTHEGASLVASAPVEAADFHCFPRMCAEVAAAVSGRFTPEAIREAVWHHRSSLNFKRPWTDPRDPLAPPLPQGPVDVPDDRVDMNAVLRTARCWTVISGHVDRIARRNIERVASTIVAAPTEAPTDVRAGQKRSRYVAQIDKRPLDRARPKATRQCLIRSFLAAPPTPRPL